MPGLWFEQFEVGAIIAHAGAHEIRQDDNAAFCRLTQNEQPLHIDSAAAAAGPFGKLLVNGLYTLALAVGVSVQDLTAGTLVANLGYDEIRHPRPVFPGDRLIVSSRVVSARPSSKPGRGVVEIETTASNQDDDVVCSFRRTILVRTRPAPEAAA